METQGTTAAPPPGAKPEKQERSLAFESGKALARALKACLVCSSRFDADGHGPNFSMSKGVLIESSGVCVGTNRISMCIAKLYACPAGDAEKFLLPPEAARWIINQSRFVHKLGYFFTERAEIRLAHDSETGTLSFGGCTASGVLIGDGALFPGYKEVEKMPRDELGPGSIRSSMFLELAAVIEASGIESDRTPISVRCEITKSKPCAFSWRGEYGTEFQYITMPINTGEE